MSDKVIVYCQNEVCLKQWRVTVQSSAEKLSEARCAECGGRLDYDPPLVPEAADDEPEELGSGEKPRAGSPAWVDLRRQMNDTERRGRRRTLVIELAVLGVFVVSIPLLFLYSKSYVRAFGLEDEDAKPAGPPHQVVVQVTPPEASLAVEGKTWPRGELTKNEMVAWTVALFGNEKKAIRIEATGYQTLEMTLHRQTPDVMKIALTPATHTLRVTSKPSGAMVFVNEKSAGRTPALVKLGLTEVGFDVRVERDGFDPGRRILDRETLDELKHRLHFDLAPSLASEVESRWAELVDRHLGSGRRVLGRWDRERRDGMDRLFGQGGDVISMRVTSEAIGFTTTLGAKTTVVATSKLAWIETRNGRAVVRTEWGDTFDGVIGEDGIRYEAQTGVPERIRLDRVAGLAFRRRGGEAEPIVPAVAVVAVGNNTFVASEAMGVVQVMTSLGATTFAGTDLVSIRRVGADELSIEARDETSVRGKLIDGEITVQLLCTGEPIEVDLKLLTAYQAGASLGGRHAEEEARRRRIQEERTRREKDEKVEDQFDELMQRLREAEAEVRRWEDAIEETLENNRALVRRREREMERFNEYKNSIIEENKIIMRNNYDNRTNYKLIELPKPNDDTAIREINDELAINRLELKNAQNELLKARRVVADLKKQIEALIESAEEDHSN